MKTDESQTTRWKFLTLLLLISSSIVLLIYAYLGRYARLMSDDFCSFYFARRLGMARYVWYSYLNWAGRYTAIATDSLIEPIGVKGLPYVPIVLLVSWVAVTSVTFYVFLQKRVETKQSVFLASAMGTTMVFLILSITPEPQGILYWWNGMRTYLPPLIGFTFYIGYLLWIPERLTKPKNLALGILISFLIAVFNSGYNETFTVVHFCFFTGLIMFLLLTRKLHIGDTYFYLLLAAVLGSIFAILVMLLSPGRAIRQDAFPQQLEIAMALKVTLDGYIKYLANMFQSPGKLSALIAELFVSIWLGSVLKINLRGRYWAIVAFLSGIILSFVSLFPVVYITSDMPAPRMLSVPSFVIAVSLLGIGIMLGNWLSNHETISTTTFVKYGLALCAGISVLWSTWMNVNLLYDGRETYSSFAQRWDRTNAQILQAKGDGNTSITISAPQNWAGLEEPNDNPKYWVTVCYSVYYEFPILGPNSDQ